MFHMSEEPVSVVLKLCASVAGDDDRRSTVGVVAVHHDPVVAGWSQLQKMAVNVPVGGIRIGGAREQMKRAQSVEVLSILAEASPRPHRAGQASTGDEEDDEEAEEETFYQASGPPPQESPPPLPPRERDSTPPVLNVLHSSPALVNDSLVLVEKRATTPSTRTRVPRVWMRRGVG